MRFKQLISITLASSILAVSIPQRANSNPAILAPLGGAALCAGTMGVACVAGAVITVAGISWQIWKAGNKDVVINQDATVLKMYDEGGMLEDPELHDADLQIESMGTKDIAEAKKRCKKEAKDSGRIYVDVDNIGNIYYCVMKGRQ
jgi:hypothetical protein